MYNSWTIFSRNYVSPKILNIFLNEKNYAACQKMGTDISYMYLLYAYYVRVGVLVMRYSFKGQSNENISTYIIRTCRGHWPMG